MKIEATFRGDAAPFEGDLEVSLRALPADSHVLSARAVVRPVSEADSRLFEETASIFGSIGDFGATKELAPDGSWAAVDFHSRRNLIAAQVTGDTSALVQVDLGGLWIPIEPDGSIASPPGAAQAFNVVAGRITLPNVVTSRIKILRVANVGSVNLTSATWLSFPSNVSLRLRGQGPFWFQLGELRDEEVTSDFSEPLRAHLLEAGIENGHAVVPLTLHSDSLARLEVALELELVRLQSLSPPGIGEVVLPFEYDPLPEAETGLLGASLPANAKVVPKITSARATGVFEPSRIVHGASLPLQSSQAVAVSTGSSQAQPIQVPQDLAADAVDFLLEPLSRTAKLSVNLLDDVNGKPWGEPLLPRQVEFELDREVSPGANWTSAALPVEYQFKAKRPDGKPRRYWLVVSSSEGEASWAAVTLANGEIGLSQSNDGGLSWRESLVQTRPANGVFRLRRTPDRFEPPIQLRVGNGDQARLVDLKQFSPLGRVDFTLDFDGVADAFNQYLADAAPPACPTVEHLANGGFERWTPLPGADFALLEDWELTSGSAVPSESQTGVPTVRLGSPGQATGLSQIVPVSAGCPYQFEFLGESTVERSRGEVIWLSEQCDEVKTDSVPITVAEFGDATISLPPLSGSPPLAGLTGALHLHRVRLQAPPDAGQAEIRFVVPAGHEVMVTAVSFRATAEAVLNGDLRETTEEGSLKSWNVTPEEQLPGDLIRVQNVAGGIRIENLSDDREAVLWQRQAIAPGRTCRLEFRGRAVGAPVDFAPRLELSWSDDAGAAVGQATVQTLDAAGFDRVLLEETAPSGASQVETRVVLPAARALEVREISLRAQEPTAVPVTFLSQAPGELSVTQGQVAYDIVQPTVPPLPPAGPCGATPPGKKPGEKPDDCCHCCTCGAQRVMVESEAVLTSRGRPAVLAACKDCGGPVLRPGGQPSRRARFLPAVKPTPQDRPLNLPPRPVGSALKLTQIHGIKEKRAARLSKHGFGSVELLAGADPRKVAKALPFISPKTAAGFIRQARRMIARSSPKP